MTDYRKEKCLRQRFILDKLEQKPLTIEEIEDFYKKNNYKIGSRTIEYDLEHLKILKIIEYDSIVKIYQIANRKQTFNNKAEYDLAMKHCRRLCFTSREKQRFDQTNPFLVLDLLAFYDTRAPMDVDDRCFVQHLKTGYFKEIYEDLEKYRGLMDKTGYSDNSSFPKLYDKIADIFSENSPQEMVSSASELKNANFRKQQVEDEIETQKAHWKLLMRENGKPTSFKVNKEDREIYNLRALLVGKIYAIVNDLSHGIPLQGFCDCCPTMKVKINQK